MAIAVGDVIAGAVSLVEPDQPVWKMYTSSQNTGECEALTTDLAGTDSQSIAVTSGRIDLELDNND